MNNDISPSEPQAMEESKEIREDIIVWLLCSCVELLGIVSREANPGSAAWNDAITGPIRPATEEMSFDSPEKLYRKTSYVSKDREQCLASYVWKGIGARASSWSKLTSAPTSFDVLVWANMEMAVDGSIGSRAINTHNTNHHGRPTILPLMPNQGLTNNSLPRRQP
jgi:hypothetical protein